MLSGGLALNNSTHTLTHERTQLNPNIDTRADDGYPALRFVNLELNHLTGSLPPEWVTEPYNLHTLDLSSNDLSGSMPDNWDVPNLVWLDLSGNLFEGECDFAFCVCVSVCTVCGEGGA